MRQRIENQILLTCNDLDLTTLTSLEVYIRQGVRFFQYVPRVLNAHEMLVVMPLKDSIRLEASSVGIQMAFTDSDGNPMASEVSEVPVEELLKEAGYDPA